MAQQGWHRDPSGAYEFRYFDGTSWTQHVSTQGQQLTDIANLNSFPLPALTGSFAPPAVPSGPPTVLAAAAPAPPTNKAASPTNGLAVAAMVLGIIGACFGLIPLFFFLALLLGLLALIFGIVGLRNVSRGAPRKGMSISGVALGTISIALGVVGVVALGEAVEDLDEALVELEESFGPATPDDYEVDVSRCGRDDLGFLEAEGIITNTAVETMDFSVTVNFEDSDGVRVAEGTDYVTSLAPGASARWTATTFESDEGNFTCEASAS